MRRSLMAKRTLGSGAVLFSFVGCSLTGMQVNSRGAATIQSQRARPASASSVTATQMGLPPGWQLGITRTGAVRERSRTGCPKSRIYVADIGNNAIEVYDVRTGNPMLCGAITDGISGPLGIYVDQTGMLYVSNFNNNTITEYPRDASSPAVTLNSGITGPMDTFVGSDGTLYVTEFSQNAVLEFDRGATSPSRTISLEGPQGVATDRKNDLYVAYNPSSGGGHVEKFLPKATTGTDLGIAVGFDGDLKLRTNTIYLGDQNAQVVNVYPPGKSSPSHSIATPNNDPYGLAFNQQQTLLYVASGAARVTYYDVKSRTLAGAITDGLTSAAGVALDPPPPY